MRNALEKLGYEIQDTKRICLDRTRYVIKHNTKGYIIIEIDESEVCGITDLSFIEKEYSSQIKAQIKTKHSKTYSDIRKYF